MKEPIILAVYPDDMVCAYDAYEIPLAGLWTFEDQHSHCPYATGKPLRPDVKLPLHQ